jgi:hypothetical protein
MLASSTATANAFRTISAVMAADAADSVPGRLPFPVDGPLSPVSIPLITSLLNLR